MPTDEIIDPITFAGLLDSLGGDVDFLSELVDAFLASSPDLLAGIGQAIAGGEPSALQRAAHSLKTGSASFGALAFAARCKELEEMAKKGALADAQARCEALEAAYHQVATALQARVDSARSAPA